jgi:hypothetical protein
MASVVSKDDIEQSVQKFSSYSMCVSKALRASGKLSMDCYKTCLKCVMDIQENKYSLYDAIKIMQLFHAEGFDYIEAFQRMIDDKRLLQAQESALARKADKSIVELLKTPEHMRLLVTTSLLSLVALAVYFCAPANLSFWGLWLVFVAIAFAFLRAGMRAKARESAKVKEHNLVSSEADDLKAKLRGKR